MIVLALDTAGIDCAAAVYDAQSGVVLSQISHEIGRGHAERLMGIMDQALEKAGVSLNDLGRIAVVVGPGSFTGIRVGVAAARGLALALKIPAVGVSTLSVLAAAQHDKTPDQAVLATMNAKREEIYMQAFDAHGQPMDAARAVTIDEAKAIAMSFDGVVTGSGSFVLHSSPEPDSVDHFPIALVARLGALADPAHGKPAPLYLRGPDVRPQAGFAVARL